MNNDFDHLTNKEKTTYLLLSCLGWGSNVKWGDNIEKRIQKKMKLENDFDPLRIRSCLDLIQDTESAIVSFSTYGLQKFSNKNYADGEMYLKLYGILNAVYLQLHSIIELYEVLKLPNKRGISAELKQLDIYEIRNIVGSHTINYIDDNESLPAKTKKNFFRITQVFLTPKCENLNAVDGFGNIKEFNLYQSILEYNKITEKILYEGVINYMKSIINAPNKIEEITKHYEISKFIPYNYEKLYKNDKLRTRYFKRIQKEIENELGDNWKEKQAKFFKDLSEGKINLSDLKKIDLKRNYDP